MIKITGKYLNISAVFLVLVVIICRRPEFFTEPRFWAEEGTVYFADAWNLGVLQGIFRPHFGYYAIVPSVATTLATFFPLELAPLITTSIACLFQVLVSCVVIYGNSPYWDSWPKKLLIAIGIQIINAPEVWLTTIGIQYWMCICTFFILLERDEKNRVARRWFLRGMLVIAGLSSVLSLFLTPLFAFKAWRSRELEEKLHVWILSICALLQSLMLFGSYLVRDSHLGMRFGGNDFNLIRVLSYNLIDPFPGKMIFTWLPIVSMDENILNLLSQNTAWPDYLPPPSVLLVLSVMTIYVLFLIVRDLCGRELPLISLAFIVVTVLSTILSLRMSSAPRYAFAPSVMLLVLFVNDAFSRNLSARKVFGIVVMIVTIIGGSLEIQTRYFYDPNWPNWRNEVEYWKMGGPEKLLIWPQWRRSRWELELRHK